MNPEQALSCAVGQAGGPSKLGGVLGISAQAVCKWRICPSRRVLSVERAPGVSVTRHELRPDLYPLEPTSAAPMAVSACMAISEPARQEAA